jgi:DNA-binding CsgD family transcriptional regulator
VPEMAFLQNRFDLTPAEARLVVHLVTGASLRSCANALGISYQTARGHLKSVFVKTGTHRQTQMLLAVIVASERTESKVSLSSSRGLSPETRPFTG